MAHPKKVAYKYVRLCELFDRSVLRNDGKINLYGVICSPVETDMVDKAHHYVQITDESISGDGVNRFVRVSIYSASNARDAEESAFRVGRVLRLHRVYVRNLNPDSVFIEGRVHELVDGRHKGMMAWVVFDGNTGKVLGTSSPLHTPSKEDDERVPQLIKWFASWKSKSSPPVDASGTFGRGSSSSSSAELQPRNMPVQARVNANKVSESPLLGLSKVYSNSNIFSCVVYVVNASRTPSSALSGKSRSDLIVWDGSGEPNSLEDESLYPLPRWIKETTRGPLRRLTVWIPEMFDIVENNKWLSFSRLSAKSNKGELELMTVDKLSTVTVLDYKSDLVGSLLSAAGCNISEVYEYMTILQQKASETLAHGNTPTSSVPAGPIHAQSVPTDGDQQQQQQQEHHHLHQRFHPQIVSRVNPRYVSLPLSCIETVRVVQPPALFHCHLCAFNLYPEIPAKAHIPVCTKCFRSVKLKETICPACKSNVRVHHMIQMRVGDDTGMLDVIVCDDPCITSLLSLLEEDGSDKWSNKYKWLVPKASTVQCKPYLDCIIVSYTTSSDSVRYKIVFTEFKAASDEE